MSTEASGGGGARLGGRARDEGSGLSESVVGGAGGGLSHKPEALTLSRTEP
jgi:hypothetical protein